MCIIFMYNVRMHTMIYISWYHFSPHHIEQQKYFYTYGGIACFFVFPHVWFHYHEIKAFEVKL